MLQNSYNHKLTSVRLHELMKDNGYNNSSFAKEVGISEAAIRKLINPDKPFNPKIETLLSMSAVLNVPIADIIVFNDDIT